MVGSGADSFSLGKEKDNMKSWKEFLRYKYDFAGTLA